MLAIISDVHGNYPALCAVLEQIRRLNCDRIISLGDIAGYYCMINECIDLLRENQVTNIMGNHDQYLLTGEGCPRSYSANVCLEHQRRIVRPDNIAWLKKSVEKIETETSSMVHGGWKDYSDEYLYAIEADYFVDKAERFFFAGHTHVQFCKTIGEKTFCNPGSVGQPRDGNPTAAFAVLERGKVELHRVEYDIKSICDKMAAAAFDTRLFENLYTGTKIGGGIATIIYGEQEGEV